jgi:ATP synthase protein I
MRTATYSLLAIQLLLTLIIAAFFYIQQGDLTVVWSACYGGGVGLGVSALLAFRLLQAARPGAGVAGLYLGAVERFVFVVAAFAVGLAVLKLAPIPLLVGFVGAEAGYYIAAGAQSSLMQSRDARDDHGC